MFWFALRNVFLMRSQLKSLGFHFDWSKVKEEEEGEEGEEQEEEEEEEGEGEEEVLL